MAAWRGYPNLLTGPQYRTKFVGTRVTSPNMARIRHHMIDKVDMGEYMGLFMSHEMDAPHKDAFAFGWGETLD